MQNFSSLASFYQKLTSGGAGGGNFYPFQFIKRTWKSPFRIGLRLIFKRDLQFLFFEINSGEIPEEYLEPNRTYMAELFAKMSNGWKALIFFAKSFIIDFDRVLKTPLDSWIFTWKVLTKVFLDLEFRLFFEIVKEKLFHKKISFLPIAVVSYLSVVELSQMDPCKLRQCTKNEVFHYGFLQ